MGLLHPSDRFQSADNVVRRQGRPLQARSTMISAARHHHPTSDSRAPASGPLFRRGCFRQRCERATAGLPHRVRQMAFVPALLPPVRGLRVTQSSRRPLDGLHGNSPPARSGNRALRPRSHAPQSISEAEHAQAFPAKMGENASQNGQSKPALCAMTRSAGSTMARN